MAAAGASGEPGLALTVKAVGADGKPMGPADTRQVRMVALHVPAGRPAANVPEGSRPVLIVTGAN